jgi:hypothetical protein
MDHHVRLKRSHEQECKRARIALPDDAGLHRTREVIGDDSQDPARRAVLRAGVKRHNEGSRALVHVDGDVFGNDFFHERHKALGDAAQHDAWIARRIDVLEIEDELRRGGDAGAHRRAEEILLRARMPQNRRRRDVQLAGDVGQCRGIEALRGEHMSGRLQELLAGDPGRPSHL